MTRPQHDKLWFRQYECQLSTQSVTNACMRSACNLHTDERILKLGGQGQMDGIIVWSHK